MWIYRISTGELTHNGILIGVGYSGFGSGRNNLDMVKVKMTGPIPLGLYKIGKAYRHDHLGPCVMNLSPLPGTEMFDRDLFRIHGNNKTNNASHGCIVMGKAIRLAVDTSGDDDLQVIP